MSGPIRVLELRSVRGTGGGPEKTILQGAARADRRRFAITVCYLRDVRDNSYRIDQQARDIGVDYVEVAERHSFDRAVWPMLVNLARTKAIDIVHAHDYKTDLLGWLLARKVGMVPLATVHGWTGHSLRERFLYYPLDKRVLTRYPQLLAVSSDIRDELCRHGARADRITVVLNGIDHRAFRRDPERRSKARAALGVTAGEFVVGAVGRLEPQKRFDLLLQAFAACRQSRPNLKLLIAGDGSLRHQLAQQLEQLKLSDACMLLGHRTDLVELYHAFDLLVQSSDYEGTPNVVLEAMAFEVPVVATAAGGTAEIVRSGTDGLVVPIGDMHALTGAVARLLDNPDAAGRLAHAARRRVERELSFERRMQAVEAIYEALVQRGVRLTRKSSAAAAPFTSG